MRVMLEASLAFAPLLDSWLDGRWMAEMRSTPLPTPSCGIRSLSFDKLCEFYARVQAGYDERRGAGTYLGERPPLLWKPVAARAQPNWINPGEVAGLIETAEVALDLGQFCRQVAAELAAAPGIETLFGMRVEAAERRPSGFRVEGVTVAGDSWQREADILVNCLWEDRLRLDESMGLRPNRAGSTA